MAKAAPTRGADGVTVAVVAVVRKLDADFDAGKHPCGKGYVAGSDPGTEARLDAIMDLIDAISPLMHFDEQWRTDSRAFETLLTKHFPDDYQELDEWVPVPFLL